MQETYLLLMSRQLKERSIILYTSGWMDILTSPARKTSEKLGSFTLSPVEPGLYRVQVSAQIRQ